jgi:stearoyl-CoA desaturase (delta-9 desaturase)
MLTQHISDFNFKIRVLQIVNHLAVIIGLVAVFLGYIGIQYLWLGLACYVWFVMIGTTIGLHRYFSHRSFKTNRVWEYIMGWSGTICTVGSIIGWAGLHRYHHAHTDTEEDPHNPHEIGIFNAWFYNWKPSKFTKKFIRLELSDPMIVFLHKNYFKTIFCYIIILAVINPWLVIFCYALPACGAYLAISAVTVIGHIHGYVTHTVADSSKNSWITSLLSLGEGWHNNHHAIPYNHRQGHKWWELDPSAWLIENVIAKNKTA